ncbi:hypothetical protein B0T45_00115 [Chromobacterium haemolyticum]|uniref:DUF1289 domain-containing protein n=2 Tax=Chromobacterium haemolyticum TaxID=394935 RepID=A0A1W0DAM0_9NEIS|nr:hypothetical protein B0T45_00115 [Chromobacterium haemolyticum]
MTLLFQGTGMTTERPDSPCIAVCSTAVGDDICRGCARSFDEISNWCFMDAEERERVWLQLPLRQRGLKIAAVFTCLPELYQVEDGEWMSVPCLSLWFRMDGDCLFWREREGAVCQRDCAGWSPAQVAAFLREQAGAEHH